MASAYENLTEANKALAEFGVQNNRLQLQVQNLRQQLSAGNVDAQGKEVCTEQNENCKKVRDESQRRIEELQEELTRLGATRQTTSSTKISAASERKSESAMASISIPSDVNVLTVLSGGVSPATVRAEIEAANRKVVTIKPKAVVPAAERTVVGSRLLVPATFAGAVSAVPTSTVKVDSTFISAQRAAAAAPFLVELINAISQTSQITIKDQEAAINAQVGSPPPGITFTPATTTAELGESAYKVLSTAQKDKTLSLWAAARLLDVSKVKVIRYFNIKLNQVLTASSSDDERCKALSALIRENFDYTAANALNIEADRKYGIPILRESAQVPLAALLNALGIPLAVARPHFGNDSELFLYQMQAMDPFYAGANLFQYLYGSRANSFYTVPILQKAFKNILANAQAADALTMQQFALLYTRYSARVAKVLSDSFRRNPRLPSLEVQTRNAIIVQVAKSIFAGANDFEGADAADTRRLIQGIFAGDQTYKTLMQYAGREFDTTDVDAFIEMFGLDFEVYGPIIEPGCNVGKDFCPTVNVQIPTTYNLINPIEDSVQVIITKS